MKLIRRRKARRAVILAAKCVASSYEPDLIYPYDPDDLADLCEAVRELRRVEAPA